MPSNLFYLPSYLVDCNTSLKFAYYFRNKIKMSLDREDIEESEEKLFSPFDLQNVIGFNLFSGIKLCKENDDDPIILCTMGHIITSYNMFKEEQTNLCVHNDLILSLDIDSKSRFIISCDKKCAIISDNSRLKEGSDAILREFLSPFENVDIAYCVISPSGRYILIVSAPNKSLEYIVQLWFWTFQRSECDASGVISSEYGKLKNIRFNPDELNEEYFVITLARAVAFSLVDLKEGKINFHIPEKRNFNELNASCYVDKTDYVVSVSSRGNMVVWYKMQNQLDNNPMSNEKEIFKTLLLRDFSINDVNMIDGYIVTVYSDGDIRFYDNQIRLMYCCTKWEFPGIFRIAPSMFPRTDVNEIIASKNYPKDYSANPKPFLVRRFMLVTLNGQMVYCDIVKNIVKELGSQNDEIITAVDHHPVDSALVMCTSTERITYFAYKNKKKISDFNLREILGLKSEKKHTKCTLLKLSPCGTFIIVGLNNGIFCLLDPITAKFFRDVKPRQFSNSAIEKITFGPNNILVYVDENFTIVLLKLLDHSIELIGKYRYHCSPIVGFYFTQFRKPEKVFSIGEDKFIYEYTIRIRDNIEKLEFVKDYRVEQSAKITAATLLPFSSLVKDQGDENDVVVLAFTDYKIRFYDIGKMEFIRTVLGPLFESPIRQIILRHSDASCQNSILIFATKKTLGTALMPLNGNPFRYLGVLVHYSKIKSISSNRDANEIYVQGEGNYGGTLWKINIPNILDYHNHGGRGLTPYCTLLPGGSDGHLFKEMRDYFYYMQLISTNLDSPLEYKIKETINITETVDYLRAVGYFPSEWEIKLMKIELAYPVGSISIAPTKIVFKDIVKLYINYKPVDGYPLSSITAAVDFFTQQDINSNSERGTISVEQLLDLLSEKYEAVSRREAAVYLLELLEPPEKAELRDKAPDIIEYLLNQEYGPFDKIKFCKVLLGIEISTSHDNIESVVGDIIYPEQFDARLESYDLPSIPEETYYMTRNERKLSRLI